ncbi:MAG: Uma2 family endonuclease [Candidatus Eremiobacterota bacterium]
MTEPALSRDEWPEEPDVSHLVTEDDTPVENWFQGKEMYLLTDVLDASWPEGRPFVSGADVGVFCAVREAIVPDMLLSKGVDYPANYHEKGRRSYFTWVFGKPPDVVVEIVSNRTGGEDTEKLKSYAEMRVPYYVIHDPFRLLSSRPLRIFQLSGASYIEKVDRFLPDIGLGFTLWEGEFDGLRGEWLRWVDPQGRLLETGKERSLRAEREAEGERQRAEEERQRAELERERAEREAQRRERMEQKLRQLGIDPDEPDGPIGGTGSS